MAILLPEDPSRYEDPVAALIKRRRQELGLSLEELARRSGVRARSYIHYIENGEKVPNEEIAVRIARALGEDEETFRAWARVRGGGTMDWEEATQSVQLLATGAIEKLRRDPRHEIMHAWLLRGSSHRVAEPTAEYGERSIFGSPDRRGVPEPIPLIREGADPGEGPVPLDTEGRIHIDPGLTAETPLLEDRLRRLERPFALWLTVANTKRCRDILPPGFLAVATRDVLPIEPREAYLVRTGSGVELGHLRFDGRRLLLMPSPDASDFETWDVTGHAELVRIVAGKVALLLPPEAVQTTR